MRPTNSERKVFILNTFQAILGYLMRSWFFNPSLTANQVFKGSPQFVEHKNLPRILIMLHYISMKNSIVGCCVLKRVHLIESAWTKNTFFVSSSCGSIWCAALTGGKEVLLLPMVYRGANVAGTRALLGPVSVVTNPVHSVRSYLGIQSRAFHLLEEHSNDCVAIIFFYHQRTALIPVAWDFNIVDPTILIRHIMPIFVCLVFFNAQMSPSNKEK